MIYESVPLPLQKAPDGREFLSDLQLAMDENIADFVKRFESSFEYDPYLCVWWFKRRMPTPAMEEAALHTEDFELPKP